MNCEKYHNVMIDVLYGEEWNPRQCFEFFRHLEECGDCNREYLELIETRETLRQWEVSAVKSKTGFFRNRATWQVRKWWPLLQKAAAGLLIVVGAVSILQYMGYLEGRQLAVSEQQFTETVRDMIVSIQTEERQLIGEALIQLKEDVDLERRDDRRQVSRYLRLLEQRYMENLEENNLYLKTLLTR